MGDDSTLTLENALLLGCRATRGGGIFDDGTLTLRNVTVTGNQAANTGGGLDLELFGTIVNSTISGNTASAGGGGIRHGVGGTLALTNVTIAANTAAAGGGGLDAPATPVTATGTIIAGNASGGPGPDCLATFEASSAGNLLSNTGGCALPDGQGNKKDQDPRLGPLANNGGETLTHALLPGSPATDAGDAATCPPADQRGVARVGVCDIGAFELENLLIAVNLNRVAYQAGDTLEVGVTAFNVDPPFAADVYLAVLVPPAAVPGCALPVAFLGSAGAVLLCGSDTPFSAFPTLASDVTIPTTVSPIAANVLTASLPAAPPGVYEVIVLVTTPDAAADGAFASGEIASIHRVLWYVN